MLPAEYATPAAVMLVAGGLLACFAGYRLFRAVLGIYGFLFGAFIATSFMGEASTWTLVVAALAGGVAGALLMIVAYFTGVGLVGAGLAALALNLVWRAVGGDPPTWLLVIVCVLGALLALSIARLVVIFGTAIAGAWTLLLGAMALLGDSTALAAALDGDVWVLYPLDPARGAWWPTLVWFALSLVGIVVQLSTTRGAGRPRARRIKPAA
jgi:hypothetical protein